MRETGRTRFVAASTTLLLLAVVACQVPPGPDLVKGNPNASTCPNVNALGNFQADANVAAGFSTIDKVTTYVFASRENENPVDGVPGLIKYCVYPNPAVPPTATDALATGANGAAWISSAGPSAFSFGRPNGDPGNIPLDGTNFNGTSRLIGTATWSDVASVPGEQTILLHINDPAVCANLYGDDPGSCFVLPGHALACITDHGETNVAYNAMPFGAADCPGGSLGFEATSTSEFGDEVELAANTGRDLASVSLKVLFSSYACKEGHWNDGTCITDPAGATNPDGLKITANIYAVNDCSGTPCKGDLLATVTPTFADLPYRPSADNTICDQGKWFNPVAGICKNSISIVLTFTNFEIQPNVPTTLPEKVIWTVAFNTTHYGAAPETEAKACFATPAGCFYDSFNVGATSFPGAPYAGTDVAENAAFLSSTWAGAYCDNGAGGTGSLRLDAGCWTGFRPLGEIITNTP